MLKRAYLELHIAVLLFGLTAILGVLIKLDVLVLVWWRMLITSISLIFLTNSWSAIRRLPRKTVLQFMGIGFLLMLHWLCFYGAIKLSNASIALACLAVTSIFSSVLEPLTTGRSVKGYEVGLSLMALPGVWLVKDQTKLEMSNGFWIGILAALLASMFSILTKKLINKAEPATITLMQLGGGWLSLNLFFPFYLYLNPQLKYLPSYADFFYLLILSLVCTTLAYILATRSLRSLSAFTVNLTVNLEPVYGITLAWLLLGENKALSTRFYMGGALIALAVFSYPLLKTKFENKEAA